MHTSNGQKVSHISRVLVTVQICTSEDAAAVLLVCGSESGPGRVQMLFGLYASAAVYEKFISEKKK